MAANLIPNNDYHDFSEAMPKKKNSGLRRADAKNEDDICDQIEISGNRGK